MKRASTLQGGIMIEKLGIDINCDHKGCDKKAHFKTDSLVSAIDEAREQGWAVCRDRKTCYCPKHASWHRNVGAMYMYGNY